MRRAVRLLAVVALGAAAFAVHAVQRSETVAVGSPPTHAAIDPVSARLFLVSGGPHGDGTVTILERDGRVATWAAPGDPVHVAVSAAHRTAIVTHSSENRVTLIHADTLERRSVAVGINPVRTLVVESTAMAYVLGKGTPSDIGSGSITAIDLRTHRAQVFPIAGFAPENAAATPDGKRLFLIGSNRQYGGEWMPGYVQAFDTARGSIVGARASLGRMPRHVLASPGGEVYVLGHVDQPRANLPAADVRRNSIRPAVFVLDGGDLALRRTIELPDTRSLDAVGPLFVGRVDFHAASNTLYVLDSLNERLSLVNPTSAEVRSVDIEAPGLALAVNPAAQSLIVSMNALGQAAVFSLAGERLDTVPIGRGTRPSELEGVYAIAVDTASGAAYVTNAHDASVSVLRPTGQTAPSLVNLTDLWVDAREPGWGVFVDQQGATLFAALFVHDVAGQPEWLVMSNGARQSDGSFSGDLFRTRGPIADALKNLVAVGKMRFDAGTSGIAAIVTYNDGAEKVTRAVQRFLFDNAPRECGWKLGERKAPVERANFTSLWSNPADPGWGLALSHQGDSAFGVLFGYDELNRPSWIVMSTGRRQARGLFTGDLYRATSRKVTSVGSMSLSFSAADRGTLRYRLDGLDFSTPIIRQAFSPLTAHCSS